jgi:hypothetical protein
MKVIGLIILAAALYFGLKTDAPSPERPWQPYALNKSTGKVEWAFLSQFKSLDECKFNADKAVKDGYYQEPSGCLYSGYQNPYVQWLVNAIMGNGTFRC